MATRKSKPGVVPSPAPTPAPTPVERVQTELLDTNETIPEGASETIAEGASETIPDGASETIETVQLPQSAFLAEAPSVATSSEVFPTQFYQANGILTCSNGDKVRSDDQGLFCWINGARVAYPEVPKVQATPTPTP